MSVVFLKPMFLVLVLLGLAPWLLPGRRRGGWHPFIRAAILILLALALARPAFLSEMDRGTEVFITDGESSEMAAWLGAHQERSQNTIESIEVTETMSLGQALEAAALKVPAGDLGSVTLMSDGLSTSPDWGNAVHQLSERGLPVHTVEQPISNNDVYPYAITALAPLKLGETARVQVGIAGQPETVLIELVNAESGDVLV